MAVTSRATVDETTRWVGDAGVGTTFPVPSTVAFTSLGATYTPPLAMVLYAAIICMAVTAMPWPNATVANVTPDHFAGSSSRPGDSNGNCSAVSWPSPNLWR